MDPGCNLLSKIVFVSNHNRNGYLIRNAKLTDWMKQLLAGIIRAVLLEDGRQPCVQVLLVLSHDAELLLPREQRDHVLLLQVQPPRDVVAALERQHAPRHRPRPELLLRLVVLQPRGAVLRLRPQHKVLLLHRLQLPEVALAHHGARATAPRARRHVSAPTSHSPTHTGTCHTITLNLFTPLMKVTQIAEPTLPLPNTRRN